METIFWGFLVRLGQVAIEAALPLVERFAEQPNKNLSQQEAKAKVAQKVPVLRARLGPVGE